MLYRSKLGLFDRAARGGNNHTNQHHFILFIFVRCTGMTPLHFIARQAWRADATPKLLSVVLKLANDRIDVHNDALETPLHQVCCRVHRLFRFIIRNVVLGLFERFAWNGTMAVVSRSKTRCSKRIWFDCVWRNFFCAFVKKLLFYRWNTIAYCYSTWRCSIS